MEVSSLINNLTPSQKDCFLFFFFWNCFETALFLNLLSFQLEKLIVGCGGHKTECWTKNNRTCSGEGGSEVKLRAAKKMNIPILSSFFFLSLFFGLYCFCHFEFFFFLLTVVFVVLNRG